MDDHKQVVVIVVQGGVVQGVYSDHVSEVVLIDYDNIKAEEGRGAVTMEIDGRISEMCDQDWRLYLREVYPVRGLGWQELADAISEQLYKMDPGDRDLYPPEMDWTVNVEAIPGDGCLEIEASYGYGDIGMTFHLPFDGGKLEFKKTWG